jgi:hypothetical protein
MMHREFTDEAGSEWVVFDVVPREEERRGRDRRHNETDAVPSDEDRRTDERRSEVRTSRPVRITRPWLCFEREGERRRLQPVPDGWHLLSELELAALLAEARIAPRRHQPSPGRMTPPQQPGSYQQLASQQEHAPRQTETPA